MKNIGLNVLSVYDHRYTKAKARTYGDNIYTNFCDLIVPEGSGKCEFFTSISIDSLLTYDHKYDLLVYFRQLCL